MEIGRGAWASAGGAYRARRHFASLDGLRCLAILPVVWHHSTPRPPSGWLGRGPLGVHLFFAVSGFLITTLLLRERRGTGTVSPRSFYARRGLRIFPLYYAVLALYAARASLLLPDSAPRAHFLGNLPYFATFTANWFVDFGVPHAVIFGFSWSLCTEEQFYALWPWVLRWSSTWRGPALVALGLLALDGAAERGLLAPVLGAHGVLVNVVTSLSAPICLGALVAILLDEPRSHRVLAPLLGAAGTAPALLAALAVLVAWDGAPLLAIHLVMAALVGAVCLSEDNGLARALCAPLVRHVGVVSYGVYLLHVAVITLVKHALPGPEPRAAAVFAVAAPLSVALATLCHRHFERPFLALRDRLRR